MTAEKIQVQAIDGEQSTALEVDELIITLPNGIAFSLFPGDPEGDEVVALIKVPDEPQSDGRGYARFVLRPGAVNQVNLAAEPLP